MVPRRAVAADLPELQALYRLSASHWEDNRDLVLAHPEWIEPTPEQVEAGSVSLVENDGGIIGFSTVTDDGELEALFVHPDAMGKGVGRCLVEAAARDLTVVANLNAVPFYEKVGFVDCGTVETVYGPALRMRRRA